jgi:hypothetical protein
MREIRAADPSVASSHGGSEGSLLAAILDGSAPRQVRLAAARGALPIERSEIFRLLVALAKDPDDELRTEACTTLEKWPREELEVIASDSSAGGEALRFLLTARGTDADLTTRLLSNPSTPVEAVAAAARSFPPDRLDLLLLNQTLLINHPELLDEIEANGSATPLQRNRVAEIRHHFLEPREAPEPEPAAPEEPPAGPPEMEASPAREETEEAPPPPPLEEAEAAPPEGEAPEGMVREGVYERVLKLNVAQKINLALKGSREERTVLIRDSNRSVQEAVLSSPKIAEPEIEGIAKMRNVNEEILRRIAQRRDWMKSYTIMQGLATNPKTPLGISMSLLPRLTLRDLKILVTDKNVPEALRRLARKNVEARVNKPSHRY